MPFAAIWVDLEIIIPSELSQTGKDILYHFFVEPKNHYK